MELCPPLLEPVPLRPLLRDAADALVWAITALVEGKGQGSGWLLDPSDLTRPNAWAIGNEGLAGAPHLYTDY